MPRLVTVVDRYGRAAVRPVRERDRTGRGAVCAGVPGPGACRGKPGAPARRLTYRGPARVRTGGWVPGSGYFLPPPLPPLSSLDSTAMNASWGTSTDPTIFIRFLPSFCFSSSFRFREMSPP